MTGEQGPGEAVAADEKARLAQAEAELEEALRTVLQAKPPPEGWGRERADDGNG